MHNVSQRIREIAEAKGNSLMWLAEQIGLSKQGFYTTLNNNTIKVDTLQKIAAVLNVPIIDFFETKEQVAQRKKDDNPLATILGVLIISWVVFSVAKSLSDVIEKGRSNANYTKDEILNDFEEKYKNIMATLESMSDVNK